MDSSGTLTLRRTGLNFFSAEKLDTIGAPDGQFLRIADTVEETDVLASKGEQRVRVHPDMRERVSP
jgi:hypothetical protein